jgi:hypothetical protein
VKRLCYLLPLLVFTAGANDGCDKTPTADQRQTQQQDVLLNEATSSVGMPGIKNFRERRLLKDILELRDQDGLITYAYLSNEFPKVVPGVTAMGGKLTFFGQTVGYGIPYATQFTSPQRPAHGFETHEHGNLALPQADPNGLFSPASAEGTWLFMKDPHGGRARPIYVEPRCVVSPFQFDFDTVPTTIGSGPAER